MSKYAINDTTLTDIADAIRGKTGETAMMTPAQMADAVRGIELSDHKWVRPSDWPDLDSIEDGFEGAYWTVDMRLAEYDACKFLDAYVVMTDGRVLIQRGHLVDSEFVVDYETTSRPVQLSEDDGIVQLWRFVPAQDGALFTAFRPTGVNGLNEQLPIGEIRASFNGSVDTYPSNRPFITHHTRRLRLRTEVSGNRAYLCSNGFALQEFVHEGTGKILDANYMFSSCAHLSPESIANLDLTACTSARAMFMNNAPKVIDLSRTGFAAQSSSTQSYFLYNTNGIEVLNLTGTDIGVNVAYNYSQLKEYYAGTMYANSISFSNCSCLTKASLMSIINAVPVASEAVTLTLGTANKLKLSDTEIAIATQKGWTVA